MLEYPNHTLVLTHKPHPGARTGILHASGYLPVSLLVRLSHTGFEFPEKRAGRQRHAILQAAYREAERRGADPWGEDDFSELETMLEAHGHDTEDVRRFME